MIDILEFVQPERSSILRLFKYWHPLSTMLGTGSENPAARFARPGYSRAMREVIARHIIEMAQQGVTDPRTLAEELVRFVSANYKDDRSGKV